MPKIDYAEIQTRYGSSYPGVLKNICDGCERKSIGDHVGLTQFGCNFTRLRPGAATSLRHWHEKEDELVIVLEGKVVLIDDFGETILHRGESAGFRAGESNGHQLINRTKVDAILFEIGTRMAEETAHYSDVDLLFKSKRGEFKFSKQDGSEIV
ncbi:MAG: transcriptional regulator [Chloroflexi bacterium]|jgi:uncharacterized cupin superfamily protein|nr:transcriptional regulator [Chloroflexota bacterium]|tara:strand:+ start:12348 stop:12809 length:462 start_codon:yes stop_codon:yes gene_type:complete